MANMPKIDQPNVIANIPQGNFSAGRITDIAGRQDAMLGNAVGKAANAMLMITKRQQDEADQLRVNDALNALNERRVELQYGVDGMASQLGINAISRNSGKLLPDEYAESLAGYADEISGSLTDRQKQLFSANAGKMISELRRDGIKHLGKEKIRYELSVVKGGLNTSIKKRTLAVANGDMETADEALREIDAFLYKSKDLEGWSANQFDMMQEAMMSKSNSMVITDLLNKGNWEAAENFLESNRNKMTMDDLFSAQTKINDFRWKSLGEREALHDYKTLLRPFTFSDAIIDITLSSESDYRDYDKAGNPLVSSAGAKYAMQVMPDTAKAPGFNIRPAKDDSPEEYNRVGRELLTALYRKYDGDVKKMWAAYNWGHGNLDRHLKAFYARQKGEGENALFHEDGWLEGMPSETKNYVATNLKKLSAAEKRIGSQITGKEQIQAKAERMTNPVIKNSYLSSLDKLQTMADRTRKQQQEAAYQQAFNEIRNGQKISSSVLDFLTPSQQKDLMNFQKSVDKGENLTTESGLYSELSMNENALLKVNLVELRVKGKLSEEDFRKFTDKKAKLRNEQAGKTHIQTPSQIVDESLLVSGFKKGKEETKRLRDYIAARIEQEEQRQNKKLSDKEIRQITNDSLAMTATTDGIFFTDNKEEGLIRIEDVPDYDRGQIRKSLLKAGLPDTNENIIHYYAMKRRKGKNG